VIKTKLSVVGWAKAKPTTFISLAISLGLMGCAVPQVIKNQYTLTQYSTKSFSRQSKLPSIYISNPEAASGFQTDQMIYRKFPYSTSIYVHNSWSSPPNEMLYSLFIQSFQDSHAFRVVGSGAHAEISRYRLDTQLLELIQNYDTKPSQVRLTLKAMISNTTTAKIIASKIFRICVPCPVDSPYGGAVAANRAAAILTGQLTTYTIGVVKHRTP
jgi:cholesterol transport system auxiliary component